MRCCDSTIGTAACAHAVRVCVRATSPGVRDRERARGVCAWELNCVIQHKQIQKGLTCVCDVSQLVCFHSMPEPTFMYQLCTSLLELENLSSEHRTEVIRNHDAPAEVIVVCSAASSREKCCSARDDKQHCACENNERTNGLQRVKTHLLRGCWREGKYMSARARTSGVHDGQKDRRRRMRSLQPRCLLLSRCGNIHGRGQRDVHAA